MNYDTEKIMKQIDGTVASNNKKREKINPPFGYFGSKNNLAMRMCVDLPPHNCWVELFCGSAALTLAKEPAQIEIINDINSEITTLFSQLRNNSEELCRQVALTPYSSEELDISRNEDKNIDDLEKARRFLVKSMMAINGAFGKNKGGFSTSNSYTRNGKEARVNRWYNLPERLLKVSERLRNVRIENKDAIELFNKFLNRPATLVYIDPPYLANRSSSYDEEIEEEEYHLELLQILNKAKCMVFISGYENQLYNSILTTKKGWVKKTIETSTRGVSGDDLSRTEVIWMNKYFIANQKTGRIPLKLTEKEVKNKKVNPER
ncbi:DNA adenine methylase [Paracrocinitomix mangrovi]|uniref:DNA adenine methylase n=1 Tax=Paracrocinitomix mangrovi TaxID=2862509 RepID=UPI001C8DEB81|nr:DNA adenine methylase [Paracrocinitomix mangrovi]UKN02320.1 DNA adenine methylase [Paracrocinitomix mangrovi]